MQVKKTQPSETEAVLAVVADAKELAPIKEHVLTHFQKNTKIPGFRAGKIPGDLLEKSVDQNALQTQFLEEAVEQLYVAAAREVNLRPVDNPQISIKKFVPFTTLEFEATVAVVGVVTLPDYTKIKKTKPEVKLTDADVKEVIKSLQMRAAEKKDVSRAAKDSDQVWIDYTGVDADTKESINGADGKDYPLVLGSNTFIPGFEPELIGLKAGDEKTFTLTFPKDYGVAMLQGRKVTFTVTVTKVQEVVEPKVDDAFAAKVGPFKTLAELKADIKKQLAIERQREADRNFESLLIKEISDKSAVAIPDVLIADQIERLMQEVQQNLVYRGQTIQEFLAAEGKTEETYKSDVLKPQAHDRVKASLVLAEIAEKEKLDVTPEELEIRMQVLKGQYKDEAMQAELEKPETRRDIASRILTEKTVSKLVAYTA
ncbi:MAG TPA: trigger factor [Verrucomicrobiae bacterium]|nr:trigger factor [Verrucomicrobiae bacterium]